METDYLTSPKIKKLRKIAGGDTYTIIYLKMQLLSVKNGGVLEYSGIEPSFPEELALILDEDEDNVKITVNFLESMGLLVAGENGEFLLPEAAEKIGSESESAERVRRFRANKALPCNDDVTQCNTDKEKENKKEKRRTDKEEKNISFDSFWSCYPKKVGKGEARKAFSKVKVSLETLLEAIERQKRSKQWKCGYIPNPSTWLNQERWEDELPEETQNERGEEKQNESTGYVSKYGLKTSLDTFDWSRLDSERKGDC